MLLLIRPAPDVAAQPVTVLAPWRIVEADGKHYLAGVLPNGYTLRASTPVQSFDVHRRTWLTLSGRVYETPGPPSADSHLIDALLVFASAHCGAQILSDRTEEFWLCIRNMLH